VPRPIPPHTPCSTNRPRRYAVLAGRLIVALAVQLIVALAGQPIVALAGQLILALAGQLIVALATQLIVALAAQLIVTLAAQLIVALAGQLIVARHLGNLWRGPRWKSIIIYALRWNLQSSNPTTTAQASVSNPAV
jgi:hypothetical protein